MLAILLLAFGLAPLQAIDTAKERKVSLNMHRVTLKEVLKKVEKQTQFTFFYSTESIDTQQKISVSLDNVTLETALLRIFEGTLISFEISGNHILLNQKIGPVKNQAEEPATPYVSEDLPPAPIAVTKSPMTIEKTVSGSVVDEANVPLPGVNVMLEGTTNGTTTDSDGKFTIIVPDENAVIIFSFIGYTTEKIVVGSQSVINIQLLQDILSLQEVVVVGYGAQKRSNITSSVTTITPSKELKDMPLANVAVALQGKIPGVVVQQVTGAPGRNPAIQVRGFGSVTAGTSPLIVVDGNIVSVEIFTLLSADEIASIDVLKDAAATAIYGSRGSNGVLLVSTRRGKSGATTVTLDAFSGVQQVTKKIDMLNAQQFAELSRDAANNAYLDAFPTASINDPNSARPVTQLRYRYPRGDLFPWLNFDDPAALASLPDTDFQDLIFRDAAINSYQLGISGGSDKVQFNGSAGYLKQEGILKFSSLDRFTLRANVDIQASPRLKVGVNINPSFRLTQDVRSDGHWTNFGVINAALSSVPMAPLYAADGSTYSSQMALAAPYGWPSITNPMANLTEYDSKSSVTTVLSNAYAEYALTDHLIFRVSGNVNLTGSRQNTYQTTRLPKDGSLPPNQAVGTTESEQRITWLTNQTLTYTNTLNDIHFVQAMVGIETNKNYFESNRGEANNFPNDFVPTLNAGTPFRVSSNRNVNAVASYFSRVNYTYKSKYLASISVRRDGSSIFGPDKRWGTFPAASLGWRVSEETFMQALPFISEAKLRASYGYAGNNAFSNSYPFAASVSSNNYILGNAVANGLSPSSLGNSILSWEKSGQLDAGIDLGLLDDRIYATVDYYKRNTIDLLLSVSVPSITGFENANQNIGEMQNEGWEFSINSRNLTGAFAWSTNANYSFNRNTVIALGTTGDPILSRSGVADTNITRIGDPIGSFYGYKQLGIFQSTEEIAAHLPNDSTTTSRPGDVKYEDVNKDGRITADDRTVIGNNQPKFIYGITNTVTYKGFDCSISVQGVYGNKILNLSRRFFDHQEGVANNMAHVADRWRSADSPGNGFTPRANAKPTGNNNATSSRWVEDGSYLRIQNVSLGYQFPKKWLEHVRMKGARIYASVQNLYTWTSYLGYNPEVSGYNDALTAGVDYGSYPLARTYTLGVNLSL